MTAGNKVKFDGTITAGHLLQLFVILGAVSAAYVTLKVTDANHETRLEAVEKQVNSSVIFQRQVLDTLTTIREDIATLKERSRDTPQRRYPP